MELSEYKTNGFLHFIGCGGAGTRPLMKIFHELGFRVSGSDMAVSYTNLTMPTTELV